ncbi:hypothetical protein [Paenibacillus sp. sgz5001063]|uniref:hypothetical protein n=1 Tax=Paenibacillus sp. sgz5001063 TaxID=3242474 RepID=UPI0036D2782A
MKKIKLLGALLLLTVVLVACGNSKDKQFSDLVTQAEKHESANDYQSAVNVYTKALDIKEDADARTALNRLTADIDQIREVKQTINDLKEQAGTYKNVMTSADLLDMCDEMTELVNRIDNFDTSGSSPAADYIQGIKNSNVYFDFTSSIESARIYRLVEGQDGHDIFSDAKGISDSLDALLASVPVPAGFSAIK